MLVSDLIAERLERQGVRHVFGVGGANIEDLFAAVQRRRPALQAILGKHEHSAGTAADAYARVSGGLGVVLTTSGGGTMNVVSALAEARASGVPVLAILGEPPTDVQGRGAFQDTSGRGDAVDAAGVFRSFANWCERVERPGDVGALLDSAIESALSARGPAVLLIAKDLQRAEVSSSGRVARLHDAARPALHFEGGSAASVRSWLSRRPIVIVAGAEIARFGLQTELERLATALDATVAVTPDARDAFDNGSARFLGVAGAMGHPTVARALEGAAVCLLAGTRLPLLARQGLEGMIREKPLLSAGRGLPFVRAAEAVHLEGDLRTGLSRLMDELGESQERLAPAPSTSVEARPRIDLLDSHGIFEAIEGRLPDGGVVLIDAGNTGASAVHYLRPPSGARWLIAMGMGGMGYTFGASIGAALASGRRCTVVAGDGAFFMHGLEIHTAVEHDLPITYVISNNRAHGMCLVREQLLLRENSGYNTFREAHIGAGLAAMFPTLEACDCRTLSELEAALDRASAVRGPVLIGAELHGVEIPPFAAFKQLTAPGVTHVGRG